MSLEMHALAPACYQGCGGGGQGQFVRLAGVRKGPDPRLGNHRGMWAASAETGENSVTGHQQNMEATLAPLPLAD